MTPEERQRMNALCVGIQEEQNYEKFATMLREMGELIARKEQRRFHEHPSIVWQRNRPSRTLPALVNKVLLSPYSDCPERVEISIAAADDLFREVRIENVLTNPDGQPVALKSGAQIDVTFEADLCDTVARETAVRDEVAGHASPSPPKQAA